MSLVSALRINMTGLCADPAAESERYRAALDMAVYAEEQGFDEILCGASMVDWMEGNEWGANDEDLYRFILETVDDESPSFNLILTTTNHPPYDIDVYGKSLLLNLNVEEAP